MSEAGQDYGWLGAIALVVATKVAWSAGHPRPAVALAGLTVTSILGLLLTHRRLTARSARARAQSQALHPAGRRRC